MVECPTSAQVIISRFVSSSPASGSVLTARGLEPALESVTLFLCPSPAHAMSLSVAQKTNVKKKFFFKCQYPWKFAHEEAGGSELAFKRAVGLEVPVWASAPQKTGLLEDELTKGETVGVGGDLWSWERGSSRSLITVKTLTLSGYFFPFPQPNSKCY